MIYNSSQMQLWIRDLNKSIRIWCINILILRPSLTHLEIGMMWLIYYQYRDFPSSRLISGGEPCFLFYESRDFCSFLFKFFTSVQNFFSSLFSLLLLLFLPLWNSWMKKKTQILVGLISVKDRDSSWITGAFSCFVEMIHQNEIE